MIFSCQKQNDVNKSVTCPYARYSRHNVTWGSREMHATRTTRLGRVRTNGSPHPRRANHRYALGGVGKQWGVDVLILRRLIRELRAIPHEITYIRCVQNTYDHFIGQNCTRDMPVQTPFNKYTSMHRGSSQPRWDASSHAHMQALVRAQSACPIHTGPGHGFNMAELQSMRISEHQHTPNGLSNAHSLRYAQHPKAPRMATAVPPDATRARSARTWYIRTIGGSLRAARRHDRLQDLCGPSNDRWQLLAVLGLKSKAPDRS